MTTIELTRPGRPTGYFDEEHPLRYSDPLRSVERRIHAETARRIEAERKRRGITARDLRGIIPGMRGGLPNTGADKAVRHPERMSRAQVLALMRALGWAEDADARDYSRLRGERTESGYRSPGEWATLIGSLTYDQQKALWALVETMGQQI